MAALLPTISKTTTEGHVINGTTLPLLTKLYSDEKMQILVAVAPTGEMWVQYQESEDPGFVPLEPTLELMRKNKARLYKALVAQDLIPSVVTITSRGPLDEDCGSA